jgi:hypothetical protein
MREPRTVKTSLKAIKAGLTLPDFMMYSNKSMVFKSLWN